MSDPSKDYWLIRKKWPKRISWALATAGVLYFLSTPFICDYTDRARVSELIVVTQEARAKVERLLIDNPAKKVVLDARELIPDALGVRSKEGDKIEIAYREISEKGEIKVFSPQLGVMIVFRPTAIDKKVSWSCWGRPLKKVPVSCRDNS